MRVNRRRLLVTMAWPLGLSWATPGHAALSGRVQAEVDALLASVEASGCSFYRNGSWHDSKAAVAHLRDKYDYLVARDLIATTEDFIERAATKSSLSGQPYEVKCGSSAAVTSSRWLYGKLASLRSSS
jgi:hypothetical protein